MPIEFVKFSHTSYVKSFLKLATNERERGFIKKLVLDTQKKNVIVYALKFDDNIVGFFGINTAKVDTIPAVQIEYIYVIPHYRTATFQELQNLKISQILIFEAAKIALELQEKVGLRWLILIPDNKKLERYYCETFGFIPYTDKTKTEYLFLKV